MTFRGQAVGYHLGQGAAQKVVAHRKLSDGGQSCHAWQLASQAIAALQPESKSAHYCKMLRVSRDVLKEWQLPTVCMVALQIDGC